MELIEPVCQPNPDAPPSIGILLVKLGRDAQRAFAETLKPTGLRPRHLATLHVLRRGPQSQLALGESVGVEPSNFVGLLDDLERGGYAQRHRDPSDRRRHIVELTQAGLDLLETFDHRVASVDHALVAVLDEGERAQLEALLTRMAQSAGLADDVAAAQRALTGSGVGGA